MNKLVPNQFPITEAVPYRLAIVGEAPGVEEEMMGVPFVGPSGQLLDRLCQRADLLRSACFVGNVFQYRPANNEIDSVDKNSPQWAECVERLRQDLLAYKPNLILCLGKTPLSLLAGKEAISKWRGSVLRSTFLPQYKAMGSFHPAYVLRQYGWAPILEMDLRKAKKEASSPILTTRTRRLIIQPSFDEVIYSLAMFSSEGNKLSIDFETLRPDGFPVCLGIANSPDFAISFPLLDGTWTTEQEFLIFQTLAKLMSSPVKKVFHNAQFDLAVFYHWLHMKVNNVYMDTMLAFHACYPELPKRLSFLTSLYTNQPFYKDMHKESEEEDNEKEWGSKTPKEKLYEYNCLDCCVTHECSTALETDLLDLRARMGYSIDMEMLPIALFMTLRGILVDQGECVKQTAFLDSENAKLTAMVTAIYGQPINVKSHKQMKELLYEQLKLPLQYKDGKLTSNADALIELARQTGNKNLLLLLRNVQVRTKKAFFNLDIYKDGRIHPSFNIAGTETGRWSSSSSILGGRNLMNIPEDCRTPYIADPGMVFIGWDKSQAEARVVAYRSFLETDDASYKNLIEAGIKPHVWFGHILVDEGVWKCSKEDLRGGRKPGEPGYAEYFTSKIGVHANSYGLGPIKFCKVIAQQTDGEVSIDTKTAKRIKEILYEKLPAIPKWQIAVQRKMQKSRVMFNAFGRSRVFFQRWGEDLFGEAYAFEPQATVADDTASSILRCYHNLDRLEILQQNYDSMFGQIPEGEVEETLAKMKDLVQRPITLHSFDNQREVTFTIPVVFKVGKSWGGLEEIK